MKHPSRARPFGRCSVFVLSSVLAACGGGRSEPSADPETAASITAAATAASTPGDGSIIGPLLAAATPSSTAPASAQTYDVGLTVEHHTFTVPANTQVRYGVPGTTQWVTQTLSGYGECTNAFFGTDPAPGSAKVCQVITTNAALATAAAGPIMSTSTGQMPAIDLTKIPTPWVAYDTARIGTNTFPTPKSDIGAFRTECGLAKLSFDDPIVLPGQIGKSHLHTFFGNTGTDGNSTHDSLRTTGHSTCQGGTANRTAYWVPTMIDTRTGAPVLPAGLGVYYKSGYELPPNVIHAIPAGLRMITGNSAAKTPGSAGYRFVCSGGPNNENDKYGTTMGDCDVGASLVQQLNFPQCWDGVNLDSPDHRSHMASPSNGACPASHPVAIPAISFNVAYVVTEAHQMQYWRLSSDNYDPTLPGGYSSHGDWFNGWDPDISDTWGADCVVAIRDCHSDLLGDGRSLY